MFRSLRWTLQLWHAALLAVVLAVVGAVVLYGARRQHYMELDQSLQSMVQHMAGSIRVAPDEDFRPFFGGPRDLPPGGPPSDDAGPDGNPGGPPRGRRPGTRGDGLPPKVTFFGFGPSESIDLRGFYYAVWQDGRGLISSSIPGAAIPTLPPPPLPQQRGPQPSLMRLRGQMREAYTYGPFGTTILVGKSMLSDEAALTHLAWMLAAMGGGVLLLGLAGGWVLSGRVLRPIRAITAVAQDISASNLSRRIDVAEAHSELGALATVLNESFSRLEAAFAQQARFTADASHELRTPLTVIHSNLQLALSRPRTAEEYRQTLETCQRASGRMKELVDSLLLLAKADAGGLALDKKACDLRHVVEESVAMVRPLAAEKSVAIETNLSPVSLSADTARMGQVAVNLLTNAIRYNAPGGTVRVSTRREEGEAVLEVTDTGVGISPEHQPHVFERFFRVDEARNRQAGGTGLGLAICKSIVEAHGGAIGCRSEFGKGTTFTVRLPGPYV
jgi:two-component system, OmpR family, sensor kinase